MHRKASTTSAGSAGSSSTVSPRMTRTGSHQGNNLERTTAKRRARNLLRDYYGLNEPSSSDSPDSPTPDAKQLFDHLYSSASLVDMLKKENETLTEIKELDSERQALVYNHHHELIDASDTIKKMKSRAESLDLSLDALRSSFESISQLTTSLSLSNPPAPPPSDQLDPLKHLPPLLDLPTELRILLQSEKRSEANTLWGSREVRRCLDHPKSLVDLGGCGQPILRSWEEAGVKGVAELSRECREVLSRNRRPSGATLLDGQ